MAHFAYPTYARAARNRRDNLARSADELKEQLGDARHQLEEAVGEMTKAQGLEGREKAAERAEFSLKPEPGMLGLRALGA